MLKAMLYALCTSLSAREVLLSHDFILKACSRLDSVGSLVVGFAAGIEAVFLGLRFLLQNREIRELVFNLVVW
jgi:hypothetical protein